MLPFVHARLARYQGLIEDSNLLAGRALRQELQLAESVVAHLHHCAQAYQSLGQSAVESRMLNLALDIHAARHVSARRAAQEGGPRPRELERAAVVAAIQASAAQLQADLQHDRQLIATAREMLSPITLAALQKQLLRPRRGRIGHAVADVQALWRSVAADDDLRLPCQRVGMAVSVYDVQLILQELLEALDAARPQRPTTGRREAIDAGQAESGSARRRPAADAGDEPG